MASGKRTAGSDLNHNNWDAEDEPEEAGIFSKASEDVLKNRVIKVAKRRNPIGSLATSTPNVEQEKKSIFANFGGFSKLPTSTTSSFSFLNNVVSSTGQPKTNGFSVASTTTTSTIVNNSTNDKSKEYYSKLKGLNESVSNWIKKHVDTNPFLNLTPIFRDYEKYFEEIERLNNILVTAKITESSTEVKTTNIPKIDDSNKTPLFGNTKGTEPSTFSFGKTNTVMTNVGFNFGSGSSSKPFTFTSTDNPIEINDGDTEIDEPPKVEFTPVVEEGYVYTVRCKFFVKKGEAYSDRGVGTLYLKPVPNNDKVQLIIRADNNLGLLLCNFILSNSIPMQRMGKKDVMLVCIPLPENTPPPVPVLLRMKSSEDADELLKTLEKHKK